VKELVIYATVTILFIKLPFEPLMYEGWNFNSDNYLFTTDTK